MIKVNSQFKGIWKCKSTDSSVRIEISNPLNNLQVRVFDSDDGEEFLVSKIICKPRTINYDYVVPSNGYSASQHLVLKNNIIYGSLSFVEDWNKVDAIESENPFVGLWKCIDDDCDLRINIVESNPRKLLVKVFDVFTKENFRSSKISKTSRTLRFCRHLPNSKGVTKHKMVLQKDLIVKHTVTLFEQWVRV